jgi:hypothetical protein
MRVSISGVQFDSTALLLAFVCDAPATGQQAVSCLLSQNRTLCIMSHLSYGILLWLSNGVIWGMKE